MEEEYMDQEDILEEEIADNLMDEGICPYTVLGTCYSPRCPLRGTPICVDYVPDDEFDD